MTPADCDSAKVGLATAERATYVVMDDGSYAQKVIEVSDGEEIGCDNMQSTKTLQFGSLVEYEEGLWAKQIVTVT